MKRFVLILLVLLLLLAACGQAAPEQPTTEPITESTTTGIIEETTTGAPFVPTEGEANEISWRTLDVNSSEGKEAVQWLAERHEEIMRGAPDQFPMGKDKTLVCRNKEKIFLRDNKTGKETALLEFTYIGEETNPELRREEEWKGPALLDVIDERYFAYCWIGWEWAGETGIYDTKNMREIPVKWDEKYSLNAYDWRFRFVGWQVRGDALYLTDGSHGEYSGTPHLMRADLKALDSLKPGEPLMAVDVLADIPGVKDAELLMSYLLTEDTRYYFLSEDRAGLRMYDLQQKKLVLRLPVSISGIGEEESYWWPDQIIQRGGQVFWTNDWTGTAVKCLVEITLP